MKRYILLLLVKQVSVPFKGSVSFFFITFTSIPFSSLSTSSSNKLDQVLVEKFSNILSFRYQFLRSDTVKALLWFLQDFLVSVGLHKYTCMSNSAYKFILPLRSIIYLGYTEYIIRKI